MPLKTSFFTHQWSSVKSPGDSLRKFSATRSRLTSVSGVSRPSLRSLNSYQSRRLTLKEANGRRERLQRLQRSQRDIGVDSIAEVDAAAEANSSQERDVGADSNSSEVSQFDAEKVKLKRRQNFEGVTGVF